jgi:hypothetical protein
MLYDLTVVSIEDKMFGLVSFQEKLLDLAFALAKGATATHDLFERILSVKTGDWFWRRYNWSAKDDPKWKQTVDALVEAFLEVEKLNAKSLDRIYSELIAVFRNDTNFHAHFSSSAFHFQFLSLDNKLQISLKNLFIHAYNYFSSKKEKGFPDFIDFESSNKISGHFFRTSFFSSNSGIHVCPYCDSRLEKKQNVRICHLDHFFPKSVYPFLALHPYNLFPSCSNCNSHFKGEKDPIPTNQSNPSSNILLDIYFGYKSKSIRDFGGLTIKREITDSEPKDKLIVEINDTSTGNETRKKAAENVLKIPSRWTDNILEVGKDWFVDIILADATDRDEQARETSEFLKYIQRKIKSLKVGKTDNDLLRSIYLNFLSENTEERHELFPYFAGTS